MSAAPIGRRALLRNTLALGGLLGLDAFTPTRTDAAQVGPKDKVKVTKIDTFVLTNSWVFVKISTDAGITGWGEMLKDDAKACAAGALEVGDYLIGQDPSRMVLHHWQAIHRGAFYRGGPKAMVGAPRPYLPRYDTDDGSVVDW
jgi:galactonate dehydratase